MVIDVERRSDVLSSNFTSFCFHTNNVGNMYICKDYILLIWALHFNADIRDSTFSLLGGCLYSHDVDRETVSNRIW